MNIKRVYKLEDLQQSEVYSTPMWCDHDAFWSFVGREVDPHSFSYKDAASDGRVNIHLKAFAHLDTEYSTLGVMLEYVAVSFDGEYIGLVIGVDRPFGWGAEEIYITNIQKFQALLAYVKTMYQHKPENVIGESTKIDDLDGRYGYKIDSRCVNNLRKESE